MIGQVEQEQPGKRRLALVERAGPPVTVPALLGRASTLADQLDAVTRDGLVLAPETVAAIGQNEARLNRWTAAALWAIALLLALVASGLIGFINGAITVKLRVPSFVTTLGTLFLINGFTLTISHGAPVSPEAGETFTTIMGAGGADASRASASAASGRIMTRAPAAPRAPAPP